MVAGQRFGPGTVTVQSGTTVRWINEADDAHTVTAYDTSVDEGAYFSTGGFDSESEARAILGEALVSKGGSYEVTFDEPGTYEYFCIPHEAQGMKGTVVVEG